MSNKLNSKQRKIRKRILEISNKYKLSHLGSCLSAVDIIMAIYEIKQKDEKFILSSGHAGVALYSVLEEYEDADADKLFLKHGVHPNRDKTDGIYCSTGSLGQGLPIALGMAFGNRDKNVYCVVTDGECAEGSVWEALRIAAEYKLSNLRILINANGFGAYGEIDINNLGNRISTFGCDLFKVDGHNIKEVKRVLKRKRRKKPLAILAATRVDQLPYLVGVHAHYKIMSDDDYRNGVKLLDL